MKLTVSNLACGYGARAVFADVSFSPQPGEFTAILGPNGAGKSTLLKAMSRLLKPRSGVVALDGADIWSMSPAAAARAVAFAPQILIPSWLATVREYVALGRAPHRGWWRPLTREDHRIVDESIDVLGLSAFRSRTVTELSGGEWQRTRIANALAREPRVLLLDEPTAHLDPRYQVEVLTAVRDLGAKRNLAVVVTLHDLNLVGAWADRVLLLADGGVLARGAPADVLTSSILTAAYAIGIRVAPHPLTLAPAVSYAPPRDRA